MDHDIEHLFYFGLEFLGLCLGVVFFVLIVSLSAVDYSGSLQMLLRKDLQLDGLQWR